MPVLKSTIGVTRNSPLLDDVTIVSGNAMVAESGPLGTILDIAELPASHQVSVYTVRERDTLTSLSKMFDVSINTILAANDIKNKTIRPGDVLVILPVSGMLHTVKKGDTLKSIAAKYKADYNEVLLFNDLDEKTVLAIGDTITIPDVDIILPVVATTAKGTTKAGDSALVRGYDGPNYSEYYMKPVAGIKTQGLHGYNGVDLAAPVGTPIYAAAAGSVIVSRTGGWNSGYGNYVVISHANKTQTLYAHMKTTAVASGEEVAQGDLLGYVGSTGKSTGPHVHFEIRGAKNPF